jgi:catechol 2,3-dioxygenase-like lactoylglutathione lyase family enzyme
MFTRTTASIICVLSCLAGCATRPENHAYQMEPRISVVTLGVSDLQRSYHFYKDGLGFPTKMTPDGGIVLFATSAATPLMLYPYEKLGKDSAYDSSEIGHPSPAFHGFTFGHCVRSREQVDAVLAQAEKAGGTVSKKPIEASWGGYSGYFRDPDGYSWEVLYSTNLKFKPDGSVIVE